jgi:hypothetical protein
MINVPVHSRSGNVVIAMLGGVYTVSAFAMLVWFVIDVWRAAAFVDRALQFCLVASAACGVWLLVVALENLGVTMSRRASRGRPVAAATRS